MSQPESRLPLLVYDGECAFCRLCADYGRQLTQGRVAYAPFQEVASQFPEIPREEFARAVQLMTPAGERYSGAEAVVRALAYGPGKAWPLWIYEKVPGAVWLSERGYEFVAAHRAGFCRLVRILWGKQCGPPPEGSGPQCGANL